jgi:hypothetical protein
VQVREREKNNLLSKVERVTNRWVESLAIEATKSIQWDWLMENTDKIKVLKASGGEPFYDNKVIQLLQHYVKTGSAKNTMLIFHTNATQFNEENVAMLNQFKKNKHTFSIDGVGKTYEYIRYPAVFSETEESVKRYIKDVKNYDPILNFVFVVSAHNILNVDDFLTWSKQLYPGVCCQFSEVYSRDRGISIQHLSIDILTEAKKHLKRPSLSVSNNNEANHNEDLFNKNRKKRQQMLDGDSDDDKSKHSNRKDRSKNSNNSLTRGHSIKIKHNDRHTPKHNSLKGKTRGYTKKASKKESLMNVSYLLNNITQKKKERSRQMLSKYMTNYQKKERNNKFAKDKADAEAKVKAEAEEKAKLQAKAEAEARNKAYELSKLEKGDMSAEQFQKQKDAILSADFTKPVDKVESFCNNIKSKEECFQHRGKCFFTDKTQLCKKDWKYKGNNNKLNNKNLKPTLGLDFQQSARKNDNLLGM